MIDDKTLIAVAHYIGCPRWDETTPDECPYLSVHEGDVAKRSAAFRSQMPDLHAMPPGWEVSRAEVEGGAENGYAAMVTVFPTTEPRRPGHHAIQGSSMPTAKPPKWLHETVDEAMEAAYAEAQRQIKEIGS